jgi:hypothetical protein
MRFYAITESLQVISDSYSTFNKVVSFLARENRTSLSAQEARDFFYSTNGSVDLYESYDDALCESVYRAARRGNRYGDEVHPNRHKYYATPIFTVELADNTKFT